MITYGVVQPNLGLRRPSYPTVDGGLTRGAAGNDVVAISERLRVKQAALDSYLELRLLVGYLGEKSQHNWWASAFYDPFAMDFLTPVFGRTARLAQYNGVREAARRVHDASVGIGQVFHLFRLPEEVEHDLHRRAESLDVATPSVVSDRAPAVSRLRALAGDSVPNVEGPIAIGVIGDLEKAGTLNRLAGHYAQAFDRRVRVYPYLTS